MGKAKALWSWIFSADLDVCCFQEHKLHHLAGQIAFHKGYTLIYGGLPGHYSGTLTCVKTSLLPRIILNHDSGRCLGISMQTTWGTILVYNVYAHNAHQDRTLLWNDLAQQPLFDGILCGDFNMVLDPVDSTTGASAATWSEKQSWDLVTSTHALQDAWNLLHADIVFTFHSQAHSNAWARLDRVYLSGTQWCPPEISLQVDCQWHWSDHFPLFLHLKLYDWKTHMKGLYPNRPLMVNNLHCKKSLFRDYVSQVCFAVNDMYDDATEKWQAFTMQMQNVIKITGKWFAYKDRRERHKHQHTLQTLRTKANVVPLSDREEQCMNHAIQMLSQADIEDTKKARFLARCHAITDNDCASKGFFDRLRSNRNRTSIASITMDDGTCITDASQLANACTHFYGQILSAPSEPSRIKSVANQAILQYVDTVVSEANANRLESPFSKEEVLYALKQLQNEKTPGIDGFSKEFMLQFWEWLGPWVLEIINTAWATQSLHPDITRGIIKLLPKQVFCSTFAHWRPISMMGIIYKIMAKAIAIRVSPLLRNTVHSSQSGFIGGRSIYDNILAVQLGVEYARRSKQEMILLQLDFAKAFDSVNWDFISNTLHKMGFGPKISNVINLLGMGAESVLSLNGFLTPAIPIKRSVRQGCPLSPLLFAVATHPLFCMLEKLSTDGVLQGLRLPQRSLAGLGFADDTLMFLQASNSNIATCLTLMGMFSDASNLKLNIDKSTLIDVSAKDFESLIWPGKRVQKGCVFRYLGYPIGIEVTNKQLLDWVLDRVRKKIHYWHSSEWPLHVRLRIIQAILIPYVLFFLPLLDWKMNHLESINSLLIRFLWNPKPGKAVCPPIRWKTVCTPKSLGGLGVLDLETHMHARRATFIHHMLDNNLPWASCMWGIIHLGTVHFHGKWELNDWDKLFTHAPLKVYALTASALIKSWKMTCARLIWKGRIRYTGNSLRAENVHWSFLFQSPPAVFMGKQCRYLAQKGVMHLHHVLDSESTFFCFFMVKRRYNLGPQYRIPWHTLCTYVHRLPVPVTDNPTDRFRDWALPTGTTNWWKAGTSTFYDLLIAPATWADKGIKLWHITRSEKWWIKVLAQTWHMHLNLQSRVFLWRVYAGGLPLASILMERGFTNGKCPRCHAAKETARHAFWFCPTVQEWYRQLRALLLALTGISLNRLQFTFGLDSYPAVQHNWLITHIRFWFLQVVWLTRNEALFSGRLLYGAGLPVYQLRTYLMESFLVDGRVNHDLLLHRLLQQVQ